MTDHSSKQYAIMSFRKSGPLKTWSDLRGAHVHNSCLVPIPNAVEDGSPPIHLIGTGDLVADVKAVLANHDIDGPREDGVICYEAVMTASASFFTTREGETDQQTDQRILAWGEAQMPFLINKYGKHRLAALTLHLDEETPHFHATIVPLKLEADHRRYQTNVSRQAVSWREFQEEEVELRLAVAKVDEDRAQLAQERAQAVAIGM